MDGMIPAPQRSLARDLVAGTVVSLVALPLCLGIALASDAPLIAGLWSGIIGGILVGCLSGSHTSVSGPAAGLATIVAAQISALGSYDIFLMSVVIGGFIQIGLGLVRAGVISAFVPTSVIRGLLAAIGVILILKQIPHLLGHDTDPEGEMAFTQPDQQNTLTELFGLFWGEVHFAAAVIGILSVAVLVLWDKSTILKKISIPAPLFVVALGVVLRSLLSGWGDQWTIEASHLVQIPVASDSREFFEFLRHPDFGQFANPAVWLGGITIALVASLETLLNIEAVDRIDPQQRYTPPNRELLSQGIGNVCAGLVGGIPITSVIVRSSVNIDSRATSKASAIFHGILLLLFVTVLPSWLNMIPLASLAAILLVTGTKLASPKVFGQMWKDGSYQFIPFLATVLAIVFTDLLSGILIGLGISIAFILHSNIRQPLRRIVERHLGGDVLRIELPNQVSFLNRAALEKLLRSAPRGSHVLLDASKTDYIDPDVLGLIREFRDEMSPAHGVQVSLQGFRNKYRLSDEIQYVDYSTRELQNRVTPLQVLQMLVDGNERFRTGHPLTRDLTRQLVATSAGQHPLAVVLSCIDSRTPAELIFDLGLGDIFSVRIAGNTISPKVLGSMEYGCAVAGAKLVLVVGHTRCGAVTAALKAALGGLDHDQSSTLDHLHSILNDIRHSVPERPCCSPEELDQMVDEVAEKNVKSVVVAILNQSATIHRLVEERQLAVVGAMYDVRSGEVRIVTPL